jgi:magnesium transporter
VRTLFNAEKGFQPVSAESVASCLQSPHEAFWLDIAAPDDEDYRLLEDTFHFHPLTIEDIQHQDQRPKLDTYDGYHFVVLFVAAFEGGDVSFREHHLYIAPRFLVSVHQQPEPAFDRLQERIREAPTASLHSPGFLTYLAVDVLVDVTFSALTSLDQAVDQLQDEILEDAATAHLVELQHLKHGVTEMRRILGAQRDMFQRLVSHSLATYDAETTAYYRDVYDHILRQAETVDSLRDLLTGAMDVYLSTVSNRLNMTMKALTVIACVFLPLTFLTGFFGMNFAWLVTRIDSPYAFAIGLIVMAISIVVQLWLFRRRGWI